jgi:hypothetical protein
MNATSILPGLETIVPPFKSMTARLKLQVKLSVKISANRGEFWRVKPNSL